MRVPDLFFTIGVCEANIIIKQKKMKLLFLTSTQASETQKHKKWTNNYSSQPSWSKSLISMNKQYNAYFPETTNTSKANMFVIYILWWPGNEQNGLRAEKFRAEKQI